MKLWNESPFCRCLCCSDGRFGRCLHAWLFLTILFELLHRLEAFLTRFVGLHDENALLILLNMKKDAVRSVIILPSVFSILLFLSCQIQSDAKTIRERDWVCQAVASGQDCFGLSNRTSTVASFLVQSEPRFNPLGHPAKCVSELVSALSIKNILGRKFATATCVVYQMKKKRMQCWALVQSVRVPLSQTEAGGFVSTKRLILL